MNNDLLTADFDFTLPSSLIAQQPADERDQSRLMVLDREERTVSHEYFSSLPRFLQAGDALVLNRSRVIPARLRATRTGGGQAELLLLRELGEDRWTAMARPSRKLRSGTTLTLDRPDLTVRIEEALGEGRWQVRFVGEGDIRSQVLEIGSMPVPPYIHADYGAPDRYQTVYADRDGSVAAPTAGLHFTHALLDRIADMGVGIGYVTLHIGSGTFKPVTSEHVAHHSMHSEWGEVPETTAQLVNATRQAGGKVVAVGTTSTRLLETAWSDTGAIPFSGETDRFIFPGYTFRAIDALVTNFHLPKSTLLMLVSAFADREFVLEAYQEAINLQYRFYSFGDAMLIL